MVQYRCTVCNYVFDEELEGFDFDKLPEEWRCPVCNSPQNVFILLEKEKIRKVEDSSVSDVMVQQMVEWGVQFVFGIPGTSSLGILDSVRKNDSIKYIQVRHEQTAALMASAYGKLTGNVAACLTVAGPGATNLATGLYDAKLDHSPVLALTGQVKRQLIGPGSFQEIDQHSFFEPMSVFNKTLMSKDQATTLTILAIKHAILKKGVSHIGIPKDVQKLPCKSEIISFKNNMPNMALTISKSLILKASQLINKSKRPVIIAGFGAMNQGKKLLKLARKIDSPVVTTFRGKGVIDEYDDLYVGSHGTIGSTAATKLVRESDLLIVIGSSYSEKTQIPEKRTIQIDIDPKMISRRYPVELGLVGNSSQLIPELTSLVDAKNNVEYLKEIRKLKKEWLNLLDNEIDIKMAPLRPQYIISVLNKKIDPHAIITLDVGENSWWFGRNFWMKSTQKLLMSGYLASMGFGLPAALAAQIVYPDKQVVCISGDGGFTMVMGDFLTAVKYKLPINVFLFNNKQLAMIQQEQMVENYHNYQTELHDCNFADYAEICGGKGIKVSDPEKLPEAVEEALSSSEPVIVDIDTDPKRFV
ncbi:MAG: thiamine pyrophosphate-binding protein [Methanobacteriaceae archaeon]|nr:thiamine pyrophosphate-binding protein [Methanobacteriaceae archaeon]